MTTTRRSERRATAAAWTAANPILAAGEWGVEISADPAVPHRAKLGDGVTPWATLPYVDAARVAAEALLIPLAQKGAANGVATLGADAKIPAAQMPDIVISDFLGAVASEAAMLALVGQRGDWAVRTDTAATWMLKGDDASLLANWQPLPTPADAVSSVDGAVGAVTLSGTYGRVADVQRLQRVEPQGVVPLLAGQPDETITPTSCTVTADTVNKRVGVQSHKLTTTGAVTFIGTFTLTAGTFERAVSGVGIEFFVEDVTKLTSFTFDLFDGSITNRFTLNASSLIGGFAANVKTGWNYLRWTPNLAVATGAPVWGRITGGRIVASCNAATSISIQRITAEVRPKGSLLFIHDGGEVGFDQQQGYGDLRDRGIPVTWAVIASFVGTNPAYLTEARLAQLAAENRNSISFHGWDGTSTASMTAPQAQAATMRAIKWLATRGYSGRVFRAAWFQNSSPQSPSTDSYVLFNPMHGGAGGSSVERIHAWPFTARWTYSRIQLHGVTNAAMDAWFTQLKANRGVMVCYTHKVDAAGGSNMTPAEWSYFLGKIDTGIAEGWLEGVTMEMLLAQSGVQIAQSIERGTTTVEWPEPDGTVSLVRLPA